MAAMPGSLVPLVSMGSPPLGVAAHQQILNSSIMVNNNIKSSIVKLVYNDHPWDPKKWPLLTDGRFSEFM
jgi:hypothetical protein